jgi:iron complex transport system substrate-binding protein
LGAQVVGVDTSSVYPPAATSLPKVGYQRTLSAEGVLALRPTRVLVSEDAGPPHALEQLRTARIPVEIIRGEASPQGARAKIRQLAQLLQVPQRGEALIAALETDLQQAQRVAVPHRAGSRRLSVLFVYARSAGAVLVAGRDTAPDAMLRLAEVDNAAAALTGFKPYSAEVLATLRPDVLLLTDRGAQSLGGAAGLRQVPGLASVPEERVVTIDDLQLLGFGPRTGQALVALKTQLAALAQRQRRLAATPSTVAAVQP